MRSTSKGTTREERHLELLICSASSGTLRLLTFWVFEPRGNEAGKLVWGPFAYPEPTEKRRP